MFDVVKRALKETSTAWMKGILLPLTNAVTHPDIGKTISNRVIRTFKFS